MDAAVHHQVRDHCLAPSRAIDAPLAGGRYARMFPDLPSLEVEEWLVYALGAAGGASDGSADRDNDALTVAAGWPFFGQFLAHDMTADRSLLSRHADTARLHNFRSPLLDLELVYGSGPVGEPFFYDRDDPVKLLLGINDAGHPRDVPRNRQGTAIVGDPRNDVHLFVSQLHVALLKLHNGLVDRLRADGVPERELFEDAQRAARWHYQWVIQHDYLPRLVGPELAAELRTVGPSWYRPEADPENPTPYLPLEFADAAFRYGHSQIRHTYRLNDTLDPLPVLPDLMQLGKPVPSTHVLDWSRLFDMPGHPPAQRARKIDGRLARSLIRLPLAITGEVDVAQYRSLAVRDLERGEATGLPSGEAVARVLGAQPLTGEETGLPALGWHGGTPLWFYVLKEAEIRQSGERLGPVGGRIVGEVLVGIIAADPTSQPSVDPAWRPTLPATTPGTFTIADLLAFAGQGG